MGSFGSFFGSESSSKTTSTSETTSVSADQRVAVEGNISGTVISPGAAVASPNSAAVVTGPKSTITTNISGLPAADVKGMLDSVLASGKSTTESISNLGASLVTGLSSQAAALSDIVAATKAPEQTALSSFLPFAALGLFLLLIFKR
jgi:hypothetical protein